MSSALSPALGESSRADPCLAVYSLHAASTEIKFEGSARPEGVWCGLHNSCLLGPQGA